MAFALLQTALILVTVQSQATPPAAFVVAATAGRQPGDAPVEARLGQRVTLYAVVRVGRGWRARYYTDAPALTLRGRRIRRRQVLPLARLGRVRVQWYLVEPFQHHKTLKPPNKGNPAYSNSVLFGRRHGRWLGFDTLEYHEALIPGQGGSGQGGSGQGGSGQRGSKLEVRKATPTHPKVNVHGGLGTMRYKAVVQWPGGAAASPGASDNRRGGISERVLRVSWREADDFVGYLTSYFNVPNVFGSAGPGRAHQTELFQGADCADVIIGGARRAGAKLAYTHAAGLLKYARRVTRKLLLTRQGLAYADGPRQGQPVRLRFGRDVRRGDIMLIDYVGWQGSPRSWDHVAVVARDQGRRGWFDPQDPVIHMGYLWGLTETAAQNEGPAIVQFLRFHPRTLRAFRRHRLQLQKKRRKLVAARGRRPR
ncbi:MAG: hypothetical protein ABI333_15105 [bacterium]